MVMCNGWRWGLYTNGVWDRDNGSNGQRSESEALALAAKLEANGNYPPGVEVTK